MKKNLLIICMLFCCFYAFSQNYKTDSMQNLLKREQPDTTKATILIALGKQYQAASPDTAYYYLQQAYKISKKHNYLSGISKSAALIGNIYLDAGNYPKALEYCIQKLKTEEERKNPESMAIAYMNIANVYHIQGDYKKALSYAFRCDSIIDANKITNLKLYSLLNLGDMFEKSGNISSALDYTLKTYAVAVKESDINVKGAALNNLGNIYAKMHSPALAIQNYSEALPYLEATNDDDFIAEASIGLAKQYMLVSMFDSSLFYGKKSYEISKKNGFLKKQLDACVFLSNFYKNKQDIKNAFAYHEEILTLKDSIYSKERIAKSQFLTMEEDLRQKEIAEKKLEEAEERKVKLQYLTIGLLLPILFFITLYLSNRKIKPKYIEFLGVVSLLLSFEYIMLLLHPLIVSITNHMPLYQLLIFAIIASVLTPLHHRIENWLVKILTKKERVSLFKIRIQ
ncbi:MAG TPA: tetratricopeptide repeat protein [Chitinophagales bacterium]|nr:tetratricopeptide repeat protein [Chitinophagales bacterium]